MAHQETAPLDRKLGAAAAAAMAAAGAASAAAPSIIGPAAAAAASVASPSAPAPTKRALRVRFVNGKELELSCEPSTTGVGLKRELERRGEGSADMLRLFYAGAEVVDAFPISMHAGKGLPDGACLQAMLGAAQSKNKAPTAATSRGALGRREGRFVGLRNQGATCYLNSLVQALFLTPDFAAAVGRLGADPAAQKAPVPRALVDLFRELREAPSAPTTEKLTSALRWGSVSRQQDVHEFWSAHLKPAALGRPPFFLFSP